MSVTAVLIAGLMAAPVVAKAHSLADALAFAYENSQILEQQRFLLRASDEDVVQSQAAFAPVIDFLARSQQTGVNGTNDSLTTTLQLNAQWLLWNAGARQLRLEATKESVLAARWGLVGVEQQVLFNAASAFLTLRQDIQEVALRESNLRLITQELRAAEDRFEVGEVTRTDVEIARARLAAARSALAAAQGQVEVSREGYILAVGRPPHALVAPPAAPELPASEDAAKSIALRTAPSIRALQHQVKALEFLATARDRDRQGTISLNSSVSTGLRDGDETTGASVGLTYQRNVFDGGSLRSFLRQATANLGASRAELAQQGRVVTEDVGRSWALLQVAQAQVLASQQQVRAAQLAFEGVREEASLGARTTLEVLNAEQELLDARNAVITAQTDAYLAVYGVLAATGLLTTDHLGLTVERYDVTDYFNTVTAPNRVFSEQGSRLDQVLQRRGRD